MSKESRRDFLKKFLPIEQDHQGSDLGRFDVNSNPDKKPGVSRRAFLEGATSSFVAALLSKRFIKKAEANQLDEEKSWGPIYNTLHELFKEDNKLFPQKKFEELTAVEQKERRRFFLKKFSPETLKQKIKIIIDEEKKIFQNIEYARHNSLKSLFERLGEFSCQGFVYQVLNEMNIYQERDRLLEVKKEAHFQCLVADYLPTADQITDAEIDPRLNDLEVSKEYMFPWVYEDREKVALRNIRKYPGWTAEYRKQQFRELISQSQIRAMIQAENWTLAESYSFIKAIIIYKENHPDAGLSDIEVTQLIKKDLETLKRIEFLGSKTEQFIALVNTEDEFEEGYQTMLEMADSCHITEDRCHIIYKDPSLPKQRKKVLLEKIAQSKGESTILISSHGYDDTIDIQGEFDVFIKSKEIASALIQRLTQVSDPSDLGKVKILLFTCLGHNFAEKVIKHMEKMYNSDKNQELRQKLGGSFAGISLPTIITAGQEGSISVIPFIAIEANIEAIKKESNITGEFLLHRIQPYIAPYTDMTFFLGNQGQLQEVGQLDQSLTSSRSV